MTMKGLTLLCSEFFEVFKACHAMTTVHLTQTHEKHAITLDVDMDKSLGDLGRLDSSVGRAFGF